MLKKRGIALGLATAVLLGAFGCGSDDANDIDTVPTEVITTESAAKADDTQGSVIDYMQLNRKNILPEMLVDSGERSQRWLSLPDSRLVLNPYSFDGAGNDTTHAQYSDSAEIPLNIGYLDPYSDTGSGRWLEGIIVMHEGSASGGVELLWSADFSGETRWSKSGGKKAVAEASDGVLSLTVLDGAPEPWQYAAQKLTAELDSSPLLTITVDSCEGNWALKLCPNGGVDIVLQGDTNRTGTFTYDIAELTGLDGTFSGTVKIFSIGYEKTLCVSRCDIGTVSETRALANEYNTTWMPHKLGFTASYPAGLKFEGEDFFADTDSVVRRIRITSAGELSLGGKLFGKVVSYGEGMLTVDCGGYSYTFEIGNNTSPMFFRDYTSYISGDKPSDTPLTDYSYYCFELGAIDSGSEIIIALTLSSDASDNAAREQKAASWLSEGASEKAISDCYSWWGNYLSRIPQPANFELEIVDSKGVTPEDTERMYYTAWVFMAQNILPANPELGFEYRQICCGKPSMWAYGDPNTAYSASWESFFGMMCLGYVMPSEAWDAYMGLMSLVDEDGMLAGESLPSEKAHTAYLLYNLTHDLDKLNTVYDNIARYLKWRVENPRWIYLEHNDLNSADADFVESALVDIEYMIEIAGITGRDSDVPMWCELYNGLFENYKKWFFDGGSTYQYCDKVNFGRASGCTIWVTKGLLIDGLEDNYVHMLIKRFESEYNDKMTFAGFTGVKYPDTAHTIYGLIKRGYNDYAAKLTEICARDVVRVGMFAECYENWNTPTPYGVRPSIFGCAMLIDSLLTLNGFMYYEGKPNIVNLCGDGGVSGIEMYGSSYSFALNSKSETARVTLGDRTFEASVPSGNKTEIQ